MPLTEGDQILLYLHSVQHFPASPAPGPVHQHLLLPVGVHILHHLLCLLLLLLPLGNVH